MAKYTKDIVREVAGVVRQAKTQNRPVSFLTGAGCSVSAGIPTAFGLLRAINESHLGETIRQQLNTDDLGKLPYGRVMAQLSAEERKEILGPFLKNAKVNWGHIALASLMKGGFVSRVLTFNFDSVLARACGINGHYPAIYDFSQVPEAKGEFDYISEPAILHLHGQGTSLAMMNSEDETAEHARKLQPLIADTLKRYDMLVIGYSGEADAAFAQIKSSATNKRRMCWFTFSETCPDHVEGIVADCQTLRRHIGGANFDDVLIALAQELGTFPPDIMAKPATHLLAEIAPIVEAADTLPIATKVMAELHQKLTQWQASEGSVSTAMKTDLLGGNPDAAQAKGETADATDPEVKDALAWIEIGRGLELAEEARAKGGDEALYHEAFAKYAEALRIKPDTHEALNNWGVALGDLAKAKDDNEALYNEAFAKYAEALRIKPDKHEAFNNWGNNLADLAKAKGDDEALYREAFQKYAEALSIKPDKYLALYHWGNGLVHLAKFKGVKDGSEALYREAFEKYAAALRVKPDMQDVLVNWGSSLADLANAKGGDEALYREAFEKYAEALRIKPNQPDTLNNWGYDLANFARLKGGDERLYREAIGKYADALRIKPDMHNALYNWAASLESLYRKLKQPELLQQAYEKTKQAEKLSGRFSYSLARILALQGKEAEASVQLSCCKTGGTLPPDQHLKNDHAFEAYREQDWFKALLS